MWKDLSLREKSAMMKVAIKNGITSLEEIENKYNEYANGGPIKSYNNWAKKLANNWGISIDELNRHDYDYKAYYNNNPEEAYNQLNNIKQGIHFPDTFKKRSHPTYPDLGDKSWNKEETVFYPSLRQMNNYDRILDYLGIDSFTNNGGTKVIYKGGNVLPTLYVTPNDKGINLKRNKQDTGWIYKDRNTYATGGPKNNKLGMLDTSTNKRFIYDNNAVPLDELVITGNNPEKIKRQQEWERNREIISYLPVLGTSLDIAEAIQNPNAGTIIPAAFSLTTDLIGGKLIYSLGKAASKTATKATSRTFRRNLNPNFVKTMGASILNLEDLYMNALQNENNP